jgi:DNA-binding response OmpR family regulator
MSEENKDKTIMIVEDDVFVMDIYQTKLEKEGFNVIVAANGLEAMKELEEKKNIPDIILLDIIMPYMDGMEVLKKIQVNDALKNIPIILLTNLSQREEIEQGMKLGAKDYLIKSHFTPSEVMEKINQHLKKHEA